MTLALTSCAPAAGPCTTKGGGEPGSIVQLRHLSFGNDQLSMLFVQRAGEPSGIPQHTVESVPGLLRYGFLARDSTPRTACPATPESCPRTLRRDRIRSVDIAEDPTGSVVIALRVDGDTCPRLASRRFGLGTTFAAALVSVALRDGPVVALDSDHGVRARGMQVVGMGFAPSSPVMFQVGAGVMWSSRSDERGYLDTILMVPDLPGRDHSALIRDAAGGTALVWFRID